MSELGPGAASMTSGAPSAGGRPEWLPFAIVVGTLVVANFLAMRKLVNFRF